MTKNEFLNILRDCIKNENYENLVSLVPYEIRLDFFEKEEFLNSKGNNVYSFFGCRGFFSHLFSEEEALNLLNSYSDIKKRYILILNLSDQEKNNYRDEVIENLGCVLDNTIFTIKTSLLYFFSTFKDNSIKNETLWNLYQEYSKKLDKQDLIFILKTLDGKHKIEVLEDIIHRQLKGEFTIINTIDVISILESFKQEQRKNVLELLFILPEDVTKEENDNTDLKVKKGVIRSYITLDIIRLFDGEEKLYITKLLLKYNAERKEFFTNVNKILNEFPKENWSEIIKSLIDRYREPLGVYNYLNDIEELCIDYSTTLFVIDMTFEIQKELTVELFSPYTFISLIEKFPINEQKEIFDKYVVENNLLPVFKTVNSITDLHFRYIILESLIENNYYQDRTFEVINQIIQTGNVLNFPNGKIKYLKINELYCNYYKLNKDNFNLFIDKFGYVALRFLDNNNIVNAINLPHADFIKYINIFDIENAKLSNNDINGICNSLLHREFRLAKKNIYNIFSTIEHLISLENENVEEMLTVIIDEIDNTVDLNICLKKYNITKNEFFNLLLKNNRNAINILHEITNLYISKQRDIYVNDRLSNIYDELFVVKRIEKQFYKKIYINKIGIVDICDDIQYRIPKKDLNQDQLHLINDKSLLTKIIEFKKNPSTVKLISEEKKYLKVFESLLNILYEMQIRKDQLTIEDAIYSYFPNEPNNENLLNIMCNTNPSAVVKNVLNNEKLYYELLEILKKYHLLGWDETFKSLTTSADIEFGDDTIAGIISYFNEIFPKLEGDSSALTKMLDYGNLYNYETVRYRYLFGIDDYRLIAANEGKNKASMPRHKRLNRGVELIRKMYQRKYTTIPPIDKNITIPNGKSLGVTVGNSTNMINLTYGERTNSCLRIGGAFNALFNFCIENENGFHIRFTNPKNGKFVSRVSGIRNGNTLFLNELRESVDDEYDNDDLYSALRLVAEELINISKNSILPIDNVIVTSDYALKKHESTEKKLHLNGEKAVLYNLPFNLKLADDLGIILKTSNADDSLVPYILDTDMFPMYECQRDRIREYINEDATMRVIQIHIINEIIAGKKIDEIEIDKNINFKYCISGEDWYVGKTFDNQIVKYIMPNSINKEKAMFEMNVILENLQSKEQEEDKGINLI